MKSILVLFALYAITGARYADPCKKLVTVKNVGYEKKILKSGINSPYQLAIDYDTNTLFFSYSTNSEDLENVFASAYISLNDKTFKVIEGVNGGFANVVDRKDKVVFIGGNDGIYSFSYDTKKALNTGSTDKSIWQLFYKNGLYFTTFPEEKSYLMKNGRPETVPELNNLKTTLIAIDNDRNIFYYFDGSLYEIKAGDDESINKGDYTINAFNTDQDGNVYFSTPDGVYEIEGDNIKEIVKLQNVYGFAIKADKTIIYADDDKIVELVISNLTCDNEKSANFVN